MAINTLDQLIAAPSQRIAWVKTSTRTTLATLPFAVIDLAGSPGAGVLAGSNTGSGVVPTDATAGCPAINDFVGGATGYLTKVEFGSTVAGRFAISDMLFKAGPYSFAAGTSTLTSQPSYASRVPGGTDFNGTEIWIEVTTTAFVTGTSWQVRVTYTNQAGVTGKTSIISSAYTAAQLIIGRMFQLALEAGDTGVQKIESVIVTNGGTAMTAGTVNVLVLRRLWMGRVRVANDGDTHDMLKTGMPQVFENSALLLQIYADSTSTGVPELSLEISSG